MKLIWVGITILVVGVFWALVSRVDQEKNLSTSAPTDAVQQVSISEPGSVDTGLSGLSEIAAPATLAEPVASVEEETPGPLDPLRWVQDPDIAFESEKVDASWAPAASNAVYQALSSAGLSLMAIDLECRTETCRLTLTHPTNAHDALGVQDYILELDPVFAKVTEGEDSPLRSYSMYLRTGPTEDLAQSRTYFQRTAGPSAVNVQLAPRNNANSNPADASEIARAMRARFDRLQQGNPSANESESPTPNSASQD